jgi:tetratricopeptide (TPR) repeat protein
MRRILLGLVVAALGALIATRLTNTAWWWVGALIGGPAGAFAPALYDWQKERAENRAHLSRQSVVYSTSPAALLAPEREIIGFTGRKQELADLLKWCGAKESSVPVRLITGPAGVGKSRLARELCVALGTRWKCHQVPNDHEANYVTDVRKVDPGPVLLIVDSAETRKAPSLRAMLKDAVQDGGQLRVLLLARSKGDWLNMLRGAEPGVSGILAAAAEAPPLAPVVDAKASDEDLVRAAVPVFARALGTNPPTRVIYAPRPYRARILDLHAAALLAVLQAERDASTAPIRIDAGDVMTQLMDNEWRYWIASAEAAEMLSGPDAPTGKVLSRIVAAGSLLGAGSEAEAKDDLLRRVPGSPATVKVATWLHDLYPPDSEAANASPTADGEWLGSPKPNRLAEQLVINELRDSPALAAACLTNLNDRQVRRALGILGRAVQETPAALPFLAQIEPELGRVARDPAASPDRLMEIADAIPYPSPPLAQVDEIITRRVLGAIPSDGAAIQRANWLFRYGSRVAQVNRIAESVTITEQAIALVRGLAEGDSNGYQPVLGRALSNLCGQLLAMGDRLQDALDAAGEAASIFRNLAEADPDRYLPFLAVALLNAGSALRAAGAQSEALQLTGVAVNIRRDLAEASPLLFRPQLASALVNMGAQTAEHGEPAQALKLEEEALAVYRDLVLTDPALYLPRLATCVFNIGIRFMELGHASQAVPFAQEAVDIRGKLAQADPGPYQYPFARALRHLGIVFTELDRFADALPAQREAIGLFRTLADEHRSRYQSELADSLSEIATTYSRLSHPEEAESARTEAAQIRSE